MKRFLLAWAALLAGICAGPVAAQGEQSSTAPAVAESTVGPTIYRAEIVGRYPHDTAAFTQGLLWRNGALFESTGRVGQSVIREVELETGRVVRESALPPDQFGEGLAAWNDQLISLTWRDGAIHRWDAETLALEATREDYPLHGWGLTASAEGLIHSDGSATLRVLDPETFAVLRSIEVTVNGRPLARLNELEMIDGLVFANVWMSPFIVAIDPSTGIVQRIVDLSTLVATVPVSETDAVLNGIAWDEENRRLFVTGKLWPELYEIRLVPTDAELR
ncbi:glutaminyl-peptide cyclotransferase [Qipengyuania sp. XHP0207]|uniref:glutaminyl-peptide cyclotransferase n=1 Tax=Qipengyuania sp. XHP0207 TaxID=3038078 RepID=UPI00241FFC4E|nr:glutaminyl-peptide cyclotransferase [Qipengyuania sp. XHP0207]MDG5748885.1 glutaminyl-peptide cyclotransferase [Qipengyuania sp. XHP0207]